MARKLASIQRIARLDPIHGADQVEKATVLGWPVVVRKGTFSEGDHVVYCETDSLIPPNVWAEFTKSELRDKPLHVKAAKIRGQMSLGIIMPLSILPSGAPSEEGMDVTDVLSITKWEPPAPTEEGIEGPFPTFIPKTDEIRLQSFPAILTELQGEAYYITQKVDGQSGTFWNLDGQFGLASRRNTLRWEPHIISSWHAVARMYGLDQCIPEGFAVQGEVVGPGIQKNRLGLQTLDLYVFDVYDIKAGVYMDARNMREWVSSLGLKLVPTVAVGEEFNMTAEYLLSIAGGLYSNGHPQEGIVVRPQVEAYSDAKGGRLSFKVINPHYLLRVKE